MRFLIVGAGAIGCFLGARLALGGQQVVLTGRPALVAAIHTAGGLLLIEPDGTRRFTAAAGAATDVSAALAAYGSYDLALLTVKAYDTADAAAELAVAGAGGPILTLQNGVGNEELLATAFGASRVFSGAIDTPVSVPAPGQVQVHRARYRIGLAPVVLPADSPAADEGRRQAAPSVGLPAAAAALTGAGFQVQRFPDHRSLKWTKLLMNMLANASCAILDWTPVQVMTDPVTARLEAQAWQEALAVMAALAIRPVTLAGYPIPLLVPAARRLPPAILARLLRSFVAGGRGSKRPSLHLALAAGRRSEVAWLNGAVARYGQQAGVPTPVNAALARILTALTTGQASPENYRGQPGRLLAEIGS